MTGARALEPGDDEEDDDEQHERNPVQVARIHDTDEERGHMLDTEPQSLFASRNVRVAAYQHRSGLGKSECDHRKRYSGDTQANRPDHEGDDDGGSDGESDRGKQFQVRLLQHNAEPVSSYREVQCMAERQQPSSTKDHMVTQRE